MPKLLIVATVEVAVVVVVVVVVLMANIKLYILKQWEKSHHKSCKTVNPTVVVAVYVVHVESSLGAQRAVTVNFVRDTLSLGA